MIVRLRCLLILALAGCAVNPATGRRELSLIGEGREIAMGREADASVTAAYGLVDDEELQRYVSDIGMRLAASSERPDLPWSFKVVDDPVVNAFALPGGFVYMTRGILAHFDSEAELAGVLGHEIGHVTARHSVSQMSQQTLLGGALGVGMILSEDVRNVGQYLGAGVQLLSLKFSRDDESQSDELGLRYVNRVGYDPNALIGVFRMLGSVSGGGGRLPEWQLTHPLPENREARMRELIARQGGASGGTVDRDEYLDQIHGIVYGENPREGYFIGARFVHPELAFELSFPSGWAGINQKSQVGAGAPDNDGVLVLQLANVTDAEVGLRDFLAQDGVSGGRIVRDDSGGIVRRSAPFGVQSNNQTLRGEAAFVAMDGQVYQIIGLATPRSWPGYASAIGRSIRSLGRLTDRRILDVQPWRLEIATVREPETLRAYHETNASPVDLDALARLNRVDPDEALAAGTRIKRVVGEPLPGR